MKKVDITKSYQSQGYQIILLDSGYLEKSCCSIDRILSTEYRAGHALTNYHPARGIRLLLIY